MFVIFFVSVIVRTMVLLAMLVVSVIVIVSVVVVTMIPVAMIVMTVIPVAMRLTELCSFCDDYLRVDDFDDYCPNGLQVEANEEVERIVCGVTASQALIDAAIETGADTILVHHGYFWKGEPQPVVGIKGRRIRSLIRNMHTRR